MKKNVPIKINEAPLLPIFIVGISTGILSALSINGFWEHGFTPTNIPLQFFIPGMLFGLAILVIYNLTLQKKSFGDQALFLFCSAPLFIVSYGLLILSFIIGINSYTFLGIFSFISALLMLFSSLPSIAWLVFLMKSQLKIKVQNKDFKNLIIISAALGLCFIPEIILGPVRNFGLGLTKKTIVLAPPYFGFIIWNTAMLYQIYLIMRKNTVEKS
jgi:hypothetical protein